MTLKNTLFLLAIFFWAICAFSFIHTPKASSYSIDELRKLYSSGDNTTWPEPLLDSVVMPYYQEIGSLPEMQFPINNPFSKEKLKLGKALFFDPRLSSSKQIACASCHDSEIAWGDGRRFSYGHDRQLGKRNAMTLFNIGYYDSLFWDGRASSLEDQVHFPLQDSLEMQSTPEIAVKHLQEIEGYKPLFQAAFGDTSINFEKIKMAIATFERSIVSRKSKFDRFIGGDSLRFTDQEVWGLHLFRTKARCVNCHHSPLFADNKFHNTGLSYYGRKFEDLGKYNVTNNPSDVGKFRTSSLREIAVSKPYMHNGLFPHLEGVINLYNAGMPHPKRKQHQLDDPLFPTTTDLVQELHLADEEQEALEAFLLTLSSRQVRERPPAFPH
ncbi:cytochrome c peroxidase [Flammeovirgaceae bacterium SG7u.111]|nr:cytochrome c peroxidase [Flammeovirgaceae bacterium SG7u.132]WPO36564.1 cytochrome c peroxidase [Flammeovirgaceae bacterium SG7u.111]